ncbi:MAG: hypothetical protein ACO3JL_05825 [Myxococcota bacterium]
MHKAFARAVLWRASTFSVIGIPLVVTTSLTGCRLFGADASACEVGTVGTCPTGERCSDEGVCIPIEAGSRDEPDDPGNDEDSGPGDDEETTPSGVTVVLTGESGVTLLARSAAKTLVWATEGEEACVRFLVAGATEAASLHCLDAGEQIGGLAVVEEQVYWLADGATDRIETLALQSSVAEVPKVVKTAAGQVRPLEEAGPAQLAARKSGEQTLLAWLPNPEETLDVERLLIQGAEVVGTTQYGVIGASASSGLALSENDVFWVTDGVYARMTVRDNTTNDDDGGYSGYTDDGSNTGFCAGAGWASTTFGADDVYISTRTASDRGGILWSRGAFDPSFLVVEEIVHSADPDDAAKYARGLATDGSFLYYTTGGAGVSTRPSLFRVSVAGGTPERLLELEQEGGQLLIDAEFLTWAEPETGRILKMPRP